ncbi:Small-conductance mechanosensitive channel [Crateriforma conspicua]|uniref:Small-conductance mechanosensitive channel n=1 Tax=Crateriforma conspicua TaxID=2527996 RepID=A0A5C6FPM1_9PLAN|nr:mechanosensitive ion channel family protein [Crateriforma conspicua]TWU62456.1 Small-conductance mechanosensitive channel [Crateriforma conspicua]
MFRLFLAITVQSCSVAALGTALAQVQDPPVDEPTSVDASTKVSSVAVNDVTDDRAIEKRLRAVFQASGWFDDLDVESRNGVITIAGIAGNDRHRDWAGDIARRTEDVVAVINQLDVREEFSWKSSGKVINASLDSLRKETLSRSPLLLAAVIVLLLTAAASKLCQAIEQRILESRGIRSSLKDLIYQLSSIGIWIIGLLVATIIAFPGMTPTRALTTLGLGTVAIGFAFKDIFENFFAGILILWRYPFDRGDYITCEETTGKVEQITVRNTMIRKLDGELAVIPNGHLFKNKVDVLTSQPQRRVRIICGVAYGEDVDQAREVIREAVQSCDTVRGIRTVEVFANEFANSSINFEVAWWTGAKPIDIRRSRDQVVAAIKRSLDEANIEIPFPYRTLTFKDDRIAASLVGMSGLSTPDSGAST